MPIGAAIATSVATVGAAVIGSSAQSKASKSAAAASAGASAADIALARETRDQNETLFAPEVARGNVADAGLDALYYGSGSIPGVDGAPSTTITRDQVFGNIAGTPLATYNDQDYASRLSEGERAYGESNTLEDQLLARQTGLINGQRTEGDQIANDQFDNLSTSFNAERTGAVDLAGAKRGDLTGLNNGRYFDQSGRINQGLIDRFSLADTAYTNARGTADENYNNTDALLQAQYLKKQGFTDQEIADFQAKSTIQEGIALDQLASRYGITGQTGKAQRSIGETTQKAALDNAQYADSKRSADYGWLADGQDSADVRRGGAYTSADLARTGSRSGAYDSYYNDSGDNLDSYYGGQAAIDNSFFGDLSDADREYYDNLDPALKKLFDQLATNSTTRGDALSGAYGADAQARSAALTGRQGARSNAYNSYAAGRATALDAYLTNLNENSQRGSQGRADIANAGASYARSATAANDSAARAYGENAINQGNIGANLALTVGKSAADAWASYDQQQKAAKIGSSSSNKIGAAGN
jgi:hypothetical protein